jgi:hypothetical protein
MEERTLELQKQNSNRSLSTRINNWIKHHQTWLLILFLLLLCLLRLL